MAVVLAAALSEVLDINNASVTTMGEGSLATLIATAAEGDKGGKEGGDAARAGTGGGA
ncbi:hypothetical protein [Acidilobus sp.]|uniref:hypothetical protein n=1 Tax=Acidilobus sp. TaxID=1872109 RepID=UPI003D035CFC